MSGAPLSNLRALEALVLLGLSFPALALAYARALTFWRRQADPHSRHVLSAATAIAAVLRLLVAPKWIVTLYIGYQLTEQAIELSADSHYGMGSLALYHALFAVLPYDHRTLLWTDAVVGVLTIPLAATFAARLLRSPRTGAMFALLVATVPLFIKFDDSDANLVPCLWWMFAGLVLWFGFLDTDGTRSLLAAAALLTLAAIARPEMPLLLPLLVALFTFARTSGPEGHARVPWRSPRILLTASFSALLLVPHVLHVLGATSSLRASHSLPGLGDGGALRIARAFLFEDTIFTPSLFPVVLPVAAIAAFVLGPRSDLRTRLLLLAAAVLAIGTYGIDLDRGNMARVQVPGAMLFTMLAADGAVLLCARLTLRHRPLAMALSIALFVASAIPTALRLWTPTNEQAEEDFLQQSIARLPPGAFTFVRLAQSDRDRSGADDDVTAYHFPDYLLRPPQREGRVSSIGDWTRTPDWSTPAFFYLGVRCYAKLRSPEAGVPHGEAMQPACAELRAHFALQPVLETTVENRGDVWLEYYGDAPELHLGLYRMVPPGG